jgi:hypothetical protein
MASVRQRPQTEKADSQTLGDRRKYANASWKEDQIFVYSLFDVGYIPFHSIARVAVKPQTRVIRCPKEQARPVASFS